MQIERLWLQDFRNYKSLDIGFPEGINVLVGANGQGKTSILEAIGYLVSHQSIKGSPNSAVLRRPDSESGNEPDSESETFSDTFIGGEFKSTGGVASKLSVQLPATGRLKGRFNSEKTLSRKELQIKFPAVTFLPSHLDLISGSPTLRRDLLDRIVLIKYPDHYHTHAELTKALKQRNAFLKSCQFPNLSSSERDLLDIYDGQLAKYGEKWARLRQAATPILEAEIIESYEVIAGKQSHISLNYIPSWVESSWIESALVEALKADRMRDLARGTTSSGPHRDDLEITLNKLPARYTASRGEQRLLTISLIFAVNRFISQKGEMPILLLDDVLSEFDPKRASALVQHFLAEQVFITSTDLEFSRTGFGDATIFEVCTNEVGAAFLK